MSDANLNNAGSSNNPAFDTNALQFRYSIGVFHRPTSSFQGIANGKHVAVEPCRF